MANTRNRGRSGSPAASLLSKPKVSETTSPVPDAVVGAPPVSTVALEEHKAKQREYREWLQKMASQTPAEADASTEIIDGETTPAPMKVPTLDELRERAQQEDLGSYLKACFEQSPDQPRYYVGLRPPRPKWGRMLLEVGDLVPGAALWPRLDAWVRSGIVVPESQMRAS